MRAFAILILVVCGIVAAQDKDNLYRPGAPVFAAAEKQNDDAIDPFLAGALGIMPFASGFFLSDRPAKGYIFTLIDVMVSLGMYTALNTRSGDPDHFPVYLMLMGANNALDAFLSARQAMLSQRSGGRVTLRPGGGVEYAVQWSF